MENIKLTYGGCTAEIKPKGGEIVSFRGADGREVIWQADPSVWAGHAPVLFPVIGIVRDGHLNIGGVDYPMTKHGFARNAQFTVAKQGDDFVELILTPSEETRAMYPFDFVFHVTYTLQENGFTTTFLVENRSDRPMPFTVGGHPAFCCPMENGAAFEDYQLVFPQAEEGRSTLVPGGLMDGYEILADLRDGRVLPLRYEYFDTRDTLLFTTLKSRSVDLVHKDSGKGLHFAFPKFEALAVWTKPNTHASYLCLEPWHGTPSAAHDTGRFEDKPFVTILEPGRCYKTWFTATLI